MNITQVNQDIFRFELYNLNYFQDCDTEISGHYTFWYSKSKKEYVFCKHGDYANLVSIRPVNENPRFPSEVEKGFLQDLISKSIRQAYFYDGAASCNRGKYLLDEIEEKFHPESSAGHESVKSKINEFYDFYPKCNCIFGLDYPSEDYKIDKGYWDKLRERDGFAIKLLDFSE